MFAKADKDNSKSISLREFKELIEGILDAEVDEESTKAVMNMFSKSPGYEIYYHDFCDALATKWTPPSYNSPNRIDQLEEQLCCEAEREEGAHAQALSPV